MANNKLSEKVNKLQQYQAKDEAEKKDLERRLNDFDEKLKEGFSEIKKQIGDLKKMLDSALMSYVTQTQMSDMVNTMNQRLNAQSEKQRLIEKENKLFQKKMENEVEEFTRGTGRHMWVLTTLLILAIAIGVINLGESLGLLSLIG